MRWFLPSIVSILLATPAAAIPFSDTLEITDANGILLNDINGQPAIVSVEDSGEPPLLSIVMAGTLAATVKAWLQEPGTVGVLSDSITITQSGPNLLTVSFSSVVSETVSCTPGYFGSPCTVETGQLQDVTPVLFPFGVPPFRVKVQSEVPEASTALLLASGVVALAATQRGRRFTA